jgi:predicted RNase H-like nuclease (RuvC/YqgF family)
MDKAQIVNDYISEYPEYAKKLVYDQRDADHEFYSKLIEEKDKRIRKMESWYDQALDWREWEVEQSEKRIAVLEASLADVKNQFEQVIKETARDMFNWLEESEVTTQVDNYRKFTMWVEDYNDIKSKYGIK